jgi:hypothetical protein
VTPGKQAVVLHLVSVDEVRSTAMANENNRRAFLRRGGLVAGAAAVLPVLGTGWDGGAAAAASDPDRLFIAGRFAAADRGYARLLRTDPGNAHAVAQRGYIALLSNRFADAERYLTEAVRLNPGDSLSKRRLTDCFVRQDMLARAVPLLQAGGPNGAALAAQYAAVTGTPYEMHGAQRTRVPFLGLDPLPHVEASVRESNPKRFLLDTGATLTFSTQTAAEAGLRAVSASTGVIGGSTVTLYHGVVGSLRLGEIELRNVPVDWLDAPMPSLPDGSQPAGVIGTTILSHFLTTMDYANGALVLRRKTSAQLRAFRAEAGRAGADRLPLWLADHFPCTLGSLGDYGPRVASLDTGGLDRGLDTSVENAQRAGFTIDYDHPQPVNGGTGYPVVARRMSLGKAVRENIPGIAGPTSFDEMFGFETIGNFTHEFFKPFAITFDFTAMDFYVARR